MSNLRLEILAGPDRLAFATSLFERDDALPSGMLTRPHFRGGNSSPSYLGEAFLVKEEDGREREYLLIIIASKRKDQDGMIQEFKALLWASCDQFRDLIFGDPTTPWVCFVGELDFQTSKGWIEQANSLS